jgi:type IV pilus assembly protein PilC
MDYQYLAYTADRRVVKGKVSAHSEQEATSMLEFGGYQIINLKEVSSFLTREKILGPPKVKSKEIVMFSRQLALLLESGVDIVTSLELLQGQSTSRALKTIIAQVVADIRSGSSLSIAMSKHPKTFNQMYSKTIAAGEQGGNLDIVLRRMADYIERAEVTKKKITSALRYPIIVFVVAFLVVILMVVYVMPTFLGLYTSLGAELPPITKMLINGANWLLHYGLYLLIFLAAIIGGTYLYIRSPVGRENFDRWLLRLPVIGRILQLNELARCCRTVSLLIRVGLPIPDIMILAVQSSGNKTVSKALNEVHDELVRGEGLSQPMAKRSIFLPLMVEMAAVGEETGNLGNTLETVAESFEAEADDRTAAAVALLQPALTVVIALVVGFIAIAMLSAMYSIYGQFSSA